MEEKWKNKKEGYTVCTTSSNSLREPYAFGSHYYNNCWSILCVYYTDISGKLHYVQYNYRVYTKP